MRTLQAQRLKKQAEYEYRHRAELMEQILGEAEAEIEKIGSLLAESGELIMAEAGRQVFEEYREDDEAVYFEQGVIER
jgi:hypothetical protein